MSELFLRGVWSLVVVFAVGLSGCFPGKGQPSGCSRARDNFVKAIEERSSNRPSSTLTPEGALLSVDRKSQITLSPGWREDKELHDKADLQASSRPEEMYIIVLSENREDFADMNLNKHSQITREALLKGVSSSQTSSPTSLTINGQPALQYEIQGIVDNLRVVYLHTTVETPKNYHQVLAWTLKSRFEKNRDALQKVIESFKEVN